MDKKVYSENEQINLKLFVTLNRCSLSVNQKSSSIIRKQGLTEAQFSVLELLYHKGDFRIKDIIEKTFSSGGTMTVIIDNLEKENFIKRKKDPRDRRAMLIEITEKGKKAIEKIFDKHLENLDNIFSVLSSIEKDGMIHLLKKLGKS
jgi:DNA-binding MarR family transcriptional regulator